MMNLFYLRIGNMPSNVNRLQLRNTTHLKNTKLNHVFFTKRFDF